jgi:hypothetical protein
MNEVLNRSASIEYLFDSIERFAPGKKGIVYAICIEHARNIANLYCSKGLKSVAIDSKTPATERICNVELFKKGEIDVLVNVDVFSEGFDCPDVEFIQLARLLYRFPNTYSRWAEACVRLKAKTLACSLTMSVCTACLVCLRMNETGKQCLRVSFLEKDI